MCDKHSMLMPKCVLHRRNTNSEIVFILVLLYLIYNSTYFTAFTQSAILIELISILISCHFDECHRSSISMNYSFGHDYYFNIMFDQFRLTKASRENAEEWSNCYNRTVTIENRSLRFAWIDFWFCFVFFRNWWMK